MSLCSLTNCNNIGNAGCCSKCYFANYCSKEHLIQHWNVEHKYQCQGLPKKLKNLIQSGTINFKKLSKNTGKLIANVEFKTADKEILCDSPLLEMDMDEWFKFYDVTTKDELLKRTKIFVSESNDENSLRTSLILHPLISSGRHSCAPNAVVGLSNAHNTNAISLVAQKEILPGDEIQISYHPWLTNHFPVEIRRKELERIFGFYCVCERCMSEEKQQDNYLQESMWSLYQEMLTKIINTHTSDTLAVITAEIFDLDNKHNIQSSHWLIHTLRIALVKKILQMEHQNTLENDQLTKMFHLCNVYEFIRQCIQRNGQNMTNLSFYKHDHFQLLKYIGEKLNKSTKQIYIDCLSADAFYEQFRLVWLNEEPMKFK